MLRIAIALCASLGFGALLATPGMPWPVRPGYIGATALVLGAVAARAHWNRRAATAGDDPGAAERAVWHGLARTGLICGFLIVTLLRPGSEFHTTTGDTGGTETWTMLAGAVLSCALLWDRHATRDERDRAITALGIRAGYTALVVLLITLLLILGFAPPRAMVRMTHWLLANTLIALMLLSALAQYVAQLVAYWRETPSGEA